MDFVPGLGVGKKTPQDSLQLETLLSLSLCHPNIVATFKVCTVEAGRMGSSGAASEVTPAGWHSPALPGVIKRTAKGKPAHNSRYRFPAAVGHGTMGAAGLTGAFGPAEAGMEEKPVPQRQCDLQCDGAATAPGASALLVEQWLPGGITAQPQPAQDSGHAIMGSVSGGALASTPVGKVPVPQRVKWATGEGDRSSTNQTAGQAMAAGTDLPSGSSSNTQANKEEGLQGTAKLGTSSKLAGHLREDAGKKGAIEANRQQEPDVGSAGSSSNSSTGQHCSWGICYACVTLPAADEVQPRSAVTNDKAHAKPDLGRTDTAWEDEGEVR